MLLDKLAEFKRSNKDVVIDTIIATWSIMVSIIFVAIWFALFS